jgi:hypothetical protein
LSSQPESRETESPQRKECVTNVFAISHRPVHPVARFLARHCTWLWPFRSHWPGIRSQGPKFPATTRKPIVTHRGWPHGSTPEQCHIEAIRKQETRKLVCRKKMLQSPEKEETDTSLATIVDTRFRVHTLQQREIWRLRQCNYRYQQLLPLTYLESYSSSTSSFLLHENIDSDYTAKPNFDRRSLGQTTFLAWSGAHELLEINRSAEVSEEFSLPWFINSEKVQRKNCRDGGADMQPNKRQCIFNLMRTTISETIIHLQVQRPWSFNVSAHIQAHLVSSVFNLQPFSSCVQVLSLWRGIEARGMTFQ